MRLAATASGIAAVLVLSACGGGGSTTIVERTVTESGSRHANATFLPFPYKQGAVVEPRFFSFVEDGSLLGRGLSWEHWGSPTAKATGIVEERNWASSDPNARRVYRGSLIASGLERCKGRSYYTEVTARVPANAVYVPEKPSQLITPCRSYQTIEAEAGPARQADTESPVIFQTPSKNIGCRMEPTRVACDILHFSWSPPPAPARCEQASAWGHTIILHANGSTFSCADNPIVTPGTQILQYGKAVVLGPFTCESREAALVCIALKTGHGITLSVEKLKLF
jgi:hypothetical protein